MATYTTNYNLTKPDGSDRAQISVLNNDFDAIDAQMKVNEDAAVEAKSIAQSKQDPITVDDAPIENSTNPIQSGAVYTLQQNTLSRFGTDEAAIQTAQTTANGAVTDAATAQSTANGAASAASAAATAAANEKTRAEGAEARLAEALDALGLQVVNGKLCAVYNT